MGIVNLINDELRKYPRIRNIIIKGIFRGQYYLHRTWAKLNKIPVGFFAPARLLTPRGKNCYFGYYDRTPYSDNELLFHCIESNSDPSSSDEAELCLVNLLNTKETIVGKTTAWNLQQGAKLNWFDKNTILWNKKVKESYFTIFYNRQTNKIKELNMPCYEFSEKHKFILSVDFERLNIYAHGYGYIGNEEKELDQHAGVYYMNIQEPQEKIEIINTRFLNEMFPPKQEGIEREYINHVTLNPSQTRFLFIHRYTHNRKLHSRLFSADIEGNNIHLLADEGMVSHFTWFNDEEFLVWCRLDGKNGYYKITDSSIPKYEIVGEGVLTEDGHPTYISDKWIITDTYPDKARYRSVLLYNVEKNEVKILARLDSPLKYDGALRCDFHPRVRPDKKAICIDSIHEGFRGIYEIDLVEE